MWNSSKSFFFFLLRNLPLHHIWVKCYFCFDLSLCKMMVLSSTQDHQWLKFNLRSEALLDIAYSFNFSCNKYISNTQMWTLSFPIGKLELLLLMCIVTLAFLINKSSGKSKQTDKQNIPFVEFYTIVVLLLSFPNPC